MIRFTISPAGVADVKGLSSEVHGAYDDVLAAFKGQIADFVGAHEHCDARTHGIQRMGEADRDGGKGLKVRVGLPGRGANRSLRVMVIAWCEDKHIQTQSVTWRRDAE